MFSGQSMKMTVTYLGGNITDLAILFWGSWYESNILFTLSSFVLANKLQSIKRSLIEKNTPVNKGLLRFRLRPKESS